MIAIEGKIDQMTKSIESQAAKQREIDLDFMTDWFFKENGDVKSLDVKLDKSYYSTTLLSTGKIIKSYLMLFIFKIPIQTNFTTIIFQP